MKQVNSDFSNAEVGDPVYHLDESVGVISFIHANSPYPIHVNDDEQYTIDGKFTNADTCPFIFTHPVKIIHADDMPVNPRIAEIERQIQRLKNEL